MIVTYAQPALNKNAGRRYPLADDVETGIPDGVLLDCRITATVPVNPLNVSVTELAARGGTVTVDLDVDGRTVRATARPGAHLAYGDNDGVRAWVAIGETPDPFRGSARLVPSVVVSDTLRVRSVKSFRSDVRPDTQGMSYLPDDAPEDATAERLSDGPLHLVPGYNVDVALIGDRVRLSAYRGAGLGQYCVTTEGNQSCGGVLYSINGELPDNSGNIRIDGGSGVVVENDETANMVTVRLDERVYEMLDEFCV